MKTPGRTDMPYWACIGLPVLSLLICWLTPLLGHDAWNALMMEETGFLETATPLLLFVAIALCILSMRHRKTLPKAMIVFLCFMLLGAIYFAGEEISWGQHWLGFATPDSIKAVNYQGEFNLHNLSEYRYYLNPAPKRVVTLAVTIGGAILPLVLLRWRGPIEKRGRLAYWLLPTWRLVPVSAIAGLSTFPNEIMKFMGVREAEGIDYLRMALVYPAQEFKEMALAMAIMLYVLSVWWRLRARSADALEPGRLLAAGDAEERLPAGTPLAHAQQTATNRDKQLLDAAPAK